MAPWLLSDSALLSPSIQLCFPCLPKSCLAIGLKYFLYLLMVITAHRGDSHIKTSDLWKSRWCSWPLSLVYTHVILLLNILIVFIGNVTTCTQIPLISQFLHIYPLPLQHPSLDCLYTMTLYSLFPFLLVPFSSKLCTLGFHVTCIIVASFNSSSTL